ncbi:winged helix-turn-helix transcriptional regulator [Nocardioides marmoriginsengisoli]|uniref:winged helix-turn-helix transcriptional regulator n=1 Tax=Nocardioides marmoriginsengisoli TaxID=661483 RepID=UPI00161FFE75|nr:helix-turn-helix domain-containing protein [Nocardioides marmoriginsengisoli]
MISDRHAIPDLFSTRWSAALVYECGRGARRFEQLQQALGISRRILAARLVVLVGDEIMERRQYQVGPPRFEYQLTAKGLALLPILRAITEWSTDWHMADVSTQRAATTYQARPIEE